MTTILPRFVQSMPVFNGALFKKVGSARPCGRVSGALSARGLELPGFNLSDSADGWNIPVIRR